MFFQRGIRRWLRLLRSRAARFYKLRGRRFQHVLDETRDEFARQLRANTQLAVGEVGSIVGSSEASAFARGFVRATGMSPSQWRFERGAR